MPAIRCIPSLPFLFPTPPAQPRTRVQSSPTQSTHAPYRHTWLPGQAVAAALAAGSAAQPQAVPPLSGLLLARSRWQRRGRRAPQAVAPAGHLPLGVSRRRAALLPSSARPACTAFRGLQSIGCAHWAPATGKESHWAGEECQQRMECQLLVGPGLEKPLQKISELRSTDAFPRARRGPQFELFGQRSIAQRETTVPQPQVMTQGAFLYGDPQLWMGHQRRDAAHIQRRARSRLGFLSPSSPLPLTNIYKHFENGRA